MLKEKDVLRVAKLAKLEVKDAELERLTKDFNNILTYVDQLKSLDVEDLTPLIHVNEDSNIFREDSVSAHESPEKLLENAPDLEERFIRVPLVFNTSDSN